VWSNEFSFQSPRSSTDRSPVTIAMYGDMGIVNSNQIIEQLSNRMGSYEWMFHIGDASYADDRDLQPQLYESILNDWAQSVEPFASRYPYMLVPGNHEASCRQVGDFLCDPRHDNFTAYRYRFKMPFSESGGNSNMWYSFDSGLVHWVGISTETDFPNSPEGPDTLWNGGPFGDQLAWLEMDLAAANQNRAIRPWIIVIGHRPLYSTKSLDWPLFISITLRAAFEPLFLKYNVDLYMSGHVHAYERQYPVCNGALQQSNYVNPTCPVHIVNGAAGNIEGHTGFGSQRDWNAYRNSADYGFGMLTVFNSTTLQWQFFRASDNGLDDAFTLIQDSHPNQA